jgi:hypothetical protein
MWRTNERDASLRFVFHLDVSEWRSESKRTLLQVLLDGGALVGGLRVVGGKAASATGPSNLGATLWGRE